MVLRGSLDEGATSRFRIVAPLGTGGFGAVYEAVDTRTGQHLAIKELDNLSAGAITRFKNEFRALADCHHPNLVALHELIEQGGRWLIVMELVPGTDLLTYVRNEQLGGFHVGGPAWDEGRLRSALSGVVEGLRALHGYGVLHRDLKPSNVRVRPDGRAVLLDFGLATSIDANEQSQGDLAVGTVRYMAPEQAAAQTVGPAADLYAVGVCLFEALCGRAPFEGEQIVSIMVAKQHHPAPRASSLAAGVPSDLDELCARLLATDPAARPSAEQVLDALGGASPAPRASLPAQFAPTRPEVFAGREPEIEHLSRALAATHRGELRIVLVEGESGVGKSELTAEFLRRSTGAHPKLWALRGRCYENEQVSYKAFDGCIDELARLMRRLPDVESAALLPVRAALLGQLFPVLRELRAVAKAPRDGVSADPTTRRLEAFAALIALLGKIAEERPLVLVIDDLQWADAESFRLLQALIEHPTPPPLLLIATIRPREELEPDVLAIMASVREWKNSGVVSLFGLPREQAKALARKLLGPTAPDGWLQMIAEESDGHPLFLSELVQYSQSQELGARGRLTLDAALRARVERLEVSARQLLELVALAARPHGVHVFARALGVGSVEEPARQLLSIKLLRARKGQELGCFHDRIRRAVVELVGPTRRVVLHRQLALALSEVSDVDPSEQAHHWDLAQDNERAVAAYELAIARAVETLAFARAVRLCERALELVADHADERAQRLTIARAHGLACAGRSREAALMYQESAQRAGGETRLRLRALAAQHLMLSAQVAEGFHAARELLLDLGVRVSLSTLRSLLRFAWDSLCVTISAKLRGEQRSVSSTTARPLVLELLPDLSGVLTVVHPQTVLTMASQYLRLAQRIGSAVDTGQALAQYAWLTAVRGSLPRALTLFERSRKLIELQGDLRALAAVIYAEGSARLVGFDLVGGSACLERAQELAREHAPDRPWLLTHIRYHLGLAWNHMGEHARIAQHAESWLAEVREHNDALSEALLYGMGHCSVRHLMTDAPEQALEEQSQALAALTPEPYSFAHYGLFMAKSYALLYRGGPAALRFLESFEPTRKRASIFATRVGRESWAALRPQAILHAYTSAGPAERPQLLREAERCLPALRGPSPLMQGHASLLAAQIEAQKGRPALALQHARDARARFESLHAGHRHLALFLEGLLQGGEQGANKREVALAAYEKQGWLLPLRAITISLPTLPLLLAAVETAPRSTHKLLLGRYELLESLGGGGFGSVVAVKEVQTGRKLALKELTRSTGVPLERFKREFRALQDLHHENLVRLDALLEHEGRWHIAMELIEGSEWLAHARPAGRCDPERTAHTIAAIARGLSALHEAGFVHRDVTPTNIRVSAEGRAVLVDFGSIARIGESDEGTSSGNAAYASPEQLAGTRPSASSDVYALGMCLHQALFGRLPFADGSPLQLAAQKRQTLARVPIAKELEQLYACCLRMLAVDPLARPTLGEVVSMLGAGLALPPVAPELDEANERDFFAGRETEISELKGGFERTCDDGLTLAFVEGESGVGKSALVAEFARRLADSWPALHVLEGRCYENEQLAFKAFDGAVDRLARVLRSLSNPQCEALLPKRAALLAQLFPVLTSVPAVAQASRKGLPADPAAQKLAARACFIELLENMCAYYEIVIVIDDLQWADGESFALLHSLVEQRTRLPLFVLCTLRPSVELTPEAEAQIARLRALPNSAQITLRGLSEVATSELAAQAYGASIDASRLRTLVRESKGHPLFLRELVAQEKRGSSDNTPLTLDTALRAHIAGLPTAARELLGLAALASRPLGAHVLALALQQGELPREAVIALLSHGLLQRRGDNLLACYHDYIRRVALEMLEPTERKRRARALANALEQTNTGEPAERARLWDEACEAKEARVAYEQAGYRALASLAFAQAERHFARAIELTATDATSAEASDARRVLLEQRGHALVRAGRSADAARVYQLAAELAQGEAAVRLRIWAAQHLIQSAQVEDGLRAASDLLHELELSLPTSDNAALLRIGWERIRSRLRGVELKSKATASQKEQLVLEALNGLSSPVSAIWVLPGSYLTVQYLRRALDAGESSHAARALALEALFRTVSSPDKSQDPLFDRSRTLAELAAVPAVVAEVDLLQGLACVARNQFALAPTYLSRAHDQLQTRCPGEPWLLTSVRQYLGFAWFYVGDIATIARHAGAWVEDARARDDRYALAALTGFGCASLRFLISDEPDAGDAELEAALAPWPDEPFSTKHFGAIVTKTSILGYGRPDELLPWLDSQAERHARSYLMRTPASRFMKGTITVSAIMRMLPEARGAARTDLLARAETELHAMRKNPSKAAPGVALMFTGLLQVARGEREQARQTFALAAAQLARAGIFWEHVARYLEGRCEGGMRGEEKAQALLDRLLADGWVDQQRALAFRVPGLDLLR